MSLQPMQFGMALRNARVEKNLTQTELSEILNISLSYIKDLEHSRSIPSYQTFEKVVRYFHLSADAIIYPEKDFTDSAYHKLKRLLTLCSEQQLRVILSVTETLLSMEKI